MTYTILMGLDGSASSVQAGAVALDLARALKARTVACHVYSAGLHSRRFREMEDGLPEQYRKDGKAECLRANHDSLIREGFQALSQGYMDEFVTRAKKLKVEARTVTVEGTHYRELCEVARREGADLIVMGAVGLGQIGDREIGGAVARTLRHAPCDVLVVRRPGNGGDLSVGIDGSAHARRAAERAACLARALGRRLRLLGAYDAEFHCEVFRAMANSLSPQRREQVNLTKQEDLHEEVINGGLRRLYDDFLAQAREHLAPHAEGLKIDSRVLEGKAYQAIVRHLVREEADLLVVGRFGHHRLDGSALGWTAETLVRLAPCNVWVCGGADAGLQEDKTELSGRLRPPQASHGREEPHMPRPKDTSDRAGKKTARKVKTKVQEASHQEQAPGGFVEKLNRLGRKIGEKTARTADKIAEKYEQGARSHPSRPGLADWPPGDQQPAMEWDDDAYARLQRVPLFVQPMARRMVEQRAIDQGARRVTLELFEQVAREFGMGPGGPAADAEPQEEKP